MQTTPPTSKTRWQNLLGKKPVQSMFYPTVASLAGARSFALV